MPSIERIQIKTNFCTAPGSYVLVVSLTPDGHSSPAISRHVLTRALQGYAFNILVCEQCQTPTCIEACPSRAMLMDAHGVVMLVDDDCLRCGGCEASCPHHAIFFNRPPDRTISCDLCLDLSQAPAFVEVRPLSTLTLRLELRTNK
jgi:Fe-S-cluster-containing dehydrogenase component